MTDGVSVQITGMADLLRDLNELPTVIQKKIMLGATATACSVIRKEAVRLAPQYTRDIQQGHPPPGTLKKAIYQARIASKCTPTVEYWIVDVRSGRKARNSKRGKGSVNLDAYYAYFVEHGHFVRQSKGLTKGQKKARTVSGKVKYIPPRPFMRPAFETKKAEAQKAFMDYLQEHIGIAVQGMRLIRIK